MNKRYITLLCLFCASFALGQKANYIIVNMGRPLPFKQNMAKHEAAKEWKIRYDYMPMSSLETVIDSVNKINTKAEKELKSKYGAEWRANLIAKTGVILDQHNIIRKQIEAHPNYKAIDEEEKLIYFEPKGCGGKSYECSVFVNRLQDNTTRQFQTVLTYTYSLKAKTLKLDSEEVKDIHFRFPENGIE